MELPRIEPLGDRALLLDWGARIDAALNAQVHAAAAAIRIAALPGITDVVPAYASLAVHYQLRPWAVQGRPFATLAEALRGLLAVLPAEASAPARVVEIPVRYGGEAGPDLEEVARHAGLAPETLIARHAAGRYRVFMLGFTPGFPYLGGLDPALAAPRRATPRTLVPAGSVGIAGQQTGIYPCDSPGGWQLIGRTEAVLFDPLRAEPCLLRPGDEVRFRALPA